MNNILSFTDVGYTYINSQPSVTISEIGVSETAIIPDAYVTALPNELKRLDTFGGEIHDNGVAHFTIKDNSTDVYIVRSIGFYSTNGTLLATLSNPSGQLDEKLVDKDLILLIDTDFSAVNFSKLIVTATDYIDPPATLSTRGALSLQDVTDVISTVVTKDYIDTLNINAFTLNSLKQSNFAQRNHFHRFSDLIDISLSTVTDGQVIMRSGTKWINTDLSITESQISDFQSYILLSEKGAIGGVAPLNGSGIIDSQYLPSYVDDVLEYTNLASFPNPGETGKIYIALDTEEMYRWSGSTYIPVGGSTGTADEALKLSTARNITLAGDASGSTLFDGSADVTITVEIADDSHNHIIANIDGLQTALDGKLNSSSYTANDVLAKILTVDGAGSDLNADKLDDLESVDFFRKQADVTDINTPTEGAKGTGFQPLNSPNGENYYTILQINRTNNSDLFTQLAHSVNGNILSARTTLDGGTTYSPWADLIDDSSVQTVAALKSFTKGISITNDASYGDFYGVAGRQVISISDSNSFIHFETDTNASGLAWGSDVSEFGSGILLIGSPSLNKVGFYDEGGVAIAEFNKVSGISGNGAGITNVKAATVNIVDETSDDINGAPYDDDTIQLKIGAWAGTQPIGAPSTDVYGAVLNLRDPSQPIQLAVTRKNNGTGGLYVRRRDSGTWNPWTGFWSDDDFSQADIDDWNGTTETVSSTTANVTLSHRDVVFVDTTSAPITVTLPATPSLGDQVTIIDGAGTFSTNNCTVGRNGQPIMGLAENMIISTDNSSVTLTYFNATHGWRIRQ